ncbi:hypothetical protein J6590_075353 [Homalodisca vitripennis]|nr:hypothetical protein J6590_075353 [Homalodisca vitripennis]
MPRRTQITDTLSGYYQSQPQIIFKCTPLSYTSQSYPSCSSPAEAEDIFSRFCVDLREVVLANCSYRSVQRNPFPIWFSVELRKCVIEKRRFHSRFKTSMNSRDYKECREDCSQFIQLSRQCHPSYIAKVEENLVTDLNTFCGYTSGLERTFSTAICESRLNLTTDLYV